jgi:diguanylate cyclase (GGDEF)-like protein/PAS domain S-box-containing protein
MSLGGLRRYAVPVAVALGYFALALAAEATAPESNHIIAFWPASGLLTGVLLLTRAERWPAIVLAAAAAVAVFNLRRHGVEATAVFVAADIAVALIGAAAVRVSIGTPDTGRIRDVLYLCGVAGVAAPAAAATVLALGLSVIGDTPGTRVWLPFVLAQAIGVVAVTPLVVAAADFARHPARRRGAIEVACLTAMSAVIALAFTLTDMPVTWLTMFVPLVAALRRGVLGASAAFLPVVVIALLSTTHDQGVFATTASSLEQAVAIAQVFVAVSVSLCTVLGAASNQLEFTRLGLRRSENRFRTLVEGVRDHAMFTLDAEGRIDSWNSSAQRMFGFGLAEVAGERLPALAAGSGARELRRGIELARESDRFEGEAGVRRADGVTFLGHFTLSPLRHEEQDREGFAVVVRDVTESRRTERRLRHLALHDPLTGLPNRALLTDRLTVGLRTTERGGGCVAVLFCDLDRFKVINDSLGHAVGDSVLVEVAARLREVVRPEDTVARFGGDEFVICCRDVEDAQHAVRLAERVRARIRQPLDIGTERIYTGGSIGIAISGAGATAEDLLRDADVAMYRAKESGAGYALATDADSARARDRLRDETAVRQALELGELALHYQPVVDLRDRRTVAVEALLRWRHPVEGLLLPGDFIRVAEETGAIVPIGAWVIREACEAGRRLRAASPAHAGLVVNVNVSARQLATDDLVATVADALVDTGTEPRLLCLELTETELMDDLPSYAATLAELERLGVRLAIDDFGAGYSSLRYLSRLPIQTVKLDRSFVAGLNSSDGGAPILRAALSMARALGLDAVAEGVEEPAQADALLQMGYTLAQGYHYARPLPEPDAAALLARPAPVPQAVL